jgi:CMP-N-acetylneuraminic acid synthetase
MKILGVIPARGGSKGVKGKNYKLLNGIPLIVYTINTANKSNLSTVIVSTDNDKIISICKDYKIETPFKRPSNLATDSSTSIEVAKHALISMEKINNTKYDAVMLLQPTSPFRTVNNINDSIKLLSNDKNADSVISVVDVEGHHPARMKFIENGILIDPEFCEKHENQNRQELEKMYIRNGAIYLTKRSILLNGSYKGKKSLALEMKSENSINIDTESDFKLAEWMLNNRLK